MQEVAQAMSRKILIAEDDSTTREIALQSLARLGFQVSAAEDGVKACEAAAREKPDLVVMDLLLPRRDGYTALLWLRSQEATRKVPVLIVTGEPSAEVKETAAALGAQGVLGKPCRPGEFVEAVQEALRAGGAA